MKEKKQKFRAKKMKSIFYMKKELKIPHITLNISQLLTLKFLDKIFHYQLTVKDSQKITVRTLRMSLSK